MNNWKNSLFCKKGYTIIETMIVVFIMLWVSLIIFNFSNVAARIRGKGQQYSKVYEDCRTAMHTLARELRESSIDSVYTANDSNGHFAIGFAQPEKDSSKTIVLAGTTVVWEKTVIYHTYIDSNNNIKLYRRKEFDRTGTATDHQQEVTNCVNSYDNNKDIEYIEKLKLKDGTTTVSTIEIVDADGDGNDNDDYIDIKFTIETKMEYNPVKTKTITLTTKVKPMNTGGE